MSDKFNSSVELLLGFDGSDGATSTSDEGPDARAVTFNGNAQLDTAIRRWGTAALLLDGTGDYLSIAHNAALSVSANPFTIEAWVYVAGGSNQRTIINKRAAAGATEFSLYIDTSGQLSFAMFSGSAVLALADTTPLATATWYHVAACREGAAGVTRLFRNGAIVASGTQSGTPGTNTSPLLIGRDGSNTARDWNGSIDEVRFTSVARYTAAFRAPRGPFDRLKNVGSAASRRQQVVALV